MLQFAALAKVLLCFARNQGSTPIGAEESNNGDKKNDDKEGSLLLGFRNETLDRAWCLQQIKVEKKTACGLQIVLRMLISLHYCELQK